MAVSYTHLHANIDSIKPIDFKTYNKLLTSELEARNIVTEHELVTIYKPNNGDEKGWMHPVSYTHLDVYKRQEKYVSLRGLKNRGG